MKVKADGVVAPELAAPAEVAFLAPTAQAEPVDLDAFVPELTLTPSHLLSQRSARHDEFKKLVADPGYTYTHAFVASALELDDLLQTAKGRAAIEYYTLTERRVGGQLVMLSAQPKVYGIQTEHGTHEFDWATAQAKGDRMRLNIRAHGARPPQVVPFSGPRSTSEPILLRTSTPVLKATREEQTMMRLMETFHEAGFIFGHPALYAHYADKPDEVRALIGRWYEHAAAPLLDKNTHVAPEHLSLLLDPGIACRPEMFASFYRERLANDPQVSAEEVRRAFAALLDKDGPMQLFRGVSLPRGEDAKRIAKQLKDGGCRAGMFREHARRPNLDASCIRPFFDPTLNQRGGRAQPNGIMDNIRSHVAGETDRSIFSSTSKFIEVTHIAGWNLMFKKHELGQFHLMRLEVPHIDVVRFEGIYQEGADVWRERDPVFWDGKNFRIDYTHPDFEMFVAGTPKVADIFPYDNAPPPYHRLDRHGPRQRT